MQKVSLILQLKILMILILVLMDMMDKHRWDPVKNVCTEPVVEGARCQVDEECSVCTEATGLTCEKSSEKYTDCPDSLQCNEAWMKRGLQLIVMVFNRGVPLVSPVLHWFMARHCIRAMVQILIGRTAFMFTFVTVLYIRKLLQNLLMDSSGYEQTIP